METRSFRVGAALAIVLVAAHGSAAQDRTTLKVPGGLAFSEFQGYESWPDVAVSETPDGIKLIAANLVMMSAYRRGLPARGRRFPEGSKVVKIEWTQTPNRVSPYPVVVPGALRSVSFIEKDSRRFPRTNGWAYAQFVYDPATRTLKPSGTGADCGYACHTRVAAQDFIFTAYPPR